MYTQRASAMIGFGVAVLSQLTSACRLPGPQLEQEVAGPGPPAGASSPRPGRALEAGTAAVEATEAPEPVENLLGESGIAEKDKDLTSWESVKADILRRWGSIKAFSGTMAASTDYGSPEQRVVERNKGRYDCMKKDDGTVLVRMDMQNATVTRQPQGDMMIRERILTLRDGENVYVMTEQSGSSSAVKHGPHALRHIVLGGETLVERLEARFDLELQPPEIINDRPVHVVKGTAKAGEGWIIYYLDKETGISIKSYGEHEGLFSKSSVILTDLDLNATFPKDHFKFVPPEGVDVLDTTIFGYEGDRPAPSAGAELNRPRND